MPGEGCTRQLKRDFRTFGVFLNKVFEKTSYKTVMRF